jgi:hypothetical protein
MSDHPGISCTPGCGMNALCQSRPPARPSAATRQHHHFHMVPCISAAESRDATSEPISPSRADCSRLRVRVHALRRVTSVGSGPSPHLLTLRRPPKLEGLECIAAHAARRSGDPATDTHSGTWDSLPSRAAPSSSARARAA